MNIAHLIKMKFTDLHTGRESCGYTIHSGHDESTDELTDSEFDLVSMRNDEFIATVVGHLLDLNSEVCNSLVDNCITVNGVELNNEHYVVTVTKGINDESNISVELA